MPDNDILQGFQAGAAVASDRANRALRMQQLQSEAAHRKMEEKNRADLLALKLKEFQLQVDQQANVAKAFGTYQAMISPDNPDPVPPGTAMVRSFGPLMQDDTQAINLLNAAGLANQRAQPDPTANERDASVITNFRSKIAAEPDPAKKVALQQQLDDFLMLAAPTGSTMETISPDGTTTRMTVGRPASAQGGLTTPVKTKAQTSIQEARKAISALDDMNFRPGDVGILGVIGEFADRFGPQFGLSNANLQRMDTRTKIKAFVESAKRTVTDDDRFTEGDRAAVKKIVISPGIEENVQTANQTRSTLKQLFGVRTLIEADTLNEPAPEWAMQALSQKRLLEAIEDGLIDDDDIITAYNAGLLTDEQAVAARRKREAQRKK